MSRTVQYTVGAECECLIFGHRISRTQLESKLNEIHLGIELTDDGSIYSDIDWQEYLTQRELETVNREADLEDHYFDPEGGIFTTEIVTPPLPSEQSFSVISKVMSLVKRYGYTNESCGCHINISPTNKKLLPQINTVYLAFHPIFNEIAEVFARSDNDYCRPNNDVAPDSIYRSIAYDREILVYGDKESAINFSPFYTNKPSEARLEIRAFGNKNYEQRFKEIKKYTKQIFKAINKSIKLHFDYIK